MGESPLVRYSVCLMASTFGIVRRPADELDHRLERVERMVQQDVVPANGSEQSPRCAPPHAARRLRRKRRVAQDGRGRASASAPSGPSDPAGRECDRPRCSDRACRLARDLLFVDDHRAISSSLPPAATSSRTASPRWRALSRSSISRSMSSDSCSSSSMSLSRVMRNVVQRQHVEAAEQLRQPGGDGLFEQDELLVCRPAPAAPTAAALAAIAPRRTIAWAPGRVRRSSIAARYSRDCDSAGWDGRVDGHRRQNRKRALAKEAVERFALFGVQLVVRQQPDALASASCGSTDSFQQRYCAATSSWVRSAIRCNCVIGPQAVGRVVLRSAVAKGLLAQARPRGP